MQTITVRLNNDTLDTLDALVKRLDAVNNVHILDDAVYFLNLYTQMLEKGYVLAYRNEVEGVHPLRIPPLKTLEHRTRVGRRLPDQTVVVLDQLAEQIEDHRTWIMTTAIHFYDFVVEMEEAGHPLKYYQNPQFPVMRVTMPRYDERFRP